MSLANRVSINIEAATSEGFNELSSTKNFNTDILRRMKWIKRLMNRDENLAHLDKPPNLLLGLLKKLMKIF